MAKRTNKKINFIPESISKPSGIKHDGTPNVAWRKFEEKIRSCDNTPLPDWESEHILGHILKRYAEHYGMEFSLSYSGPPTKCSEMFCVKRIMTTVGSQKGWILKDYIDWVFDKIIIPKKTAVTSLAFFFTKDIANQFKAEFKKRSTITKSTELPDNYLNLVTSLNLSACTYGDLAFIKMAVENDPDRDDFAAYHELFKKLDENGFDISALQTLIE
jgi:hypothetical protein